MNGLVTKTIRVLFQLHEHPETFFRIGTVNESPATSKVKRKWEKNDGKLNLVCRKFCYYTYRKPQNCSANVCVFDLFATRRNVFGWFFARIFLCIYSFVFSETTSESWNLLHIFLFSFFLCYSSFCLSLNVSHFAHLIL